MILFSQESEEEQVDIEPPVPSTRKSRSETPQAPVVDLEKWRKDRFSGKDDQIESADREELQGLMSELIKKDDPYAGLNSSDQRLIESVLLQLMKGDSKGTVAWLQAAFQQATSDHLLVVGIEEFLEVDFQQALGLTLASLDQRLHPELA